MDASSSLLSYISPLLIISVEFKRKHKRLINLIKTEVKSYILGTNTHHIIQIFKKKNCNSPFSCDFLIFNVLHHKVQSITSLAITTVVHIQEQQRKEKISQFSLSHGTETESLGSNSSKTKYSEKIDVYALFQFSSLL